MIARRKRGTVAPETPARHVAQWLRRLESERRCSAHTLAAYRRDLEEFIGSIPEGTDLQQVGTSQVREHVAALHRRGLAPRTLQRKLSAIRSFFAACIEEGLLHCNPAAEVRAPRSPRKLPQTLDPDQVSRLLEIQGNDPLTLRDRAMMELLYSSGLRLSELVGCNLGDIDLAQGLVRVTGKGRKTREIPVGSKARDALRDWIRVRSALAAEGEQAMFLGRRGRRLHPRTVQQRLRAWQVRQGLSARLHPHLFRHSFASHLLESSGELRAVQELLGHADISTTQIYTHLDYQHLAKVYDQAHPRARKKD